MENYIEGASFVTPSMFLFLKPKWENIEDAIFRSNLYVLIKMHLDISTVGFTKEC